MKDISTGVNELPLHVRSYLQKYAQPGWTTELSSGKRYNNIVVIPAIQEYDNLRNLLLSLKANDKKYFDETLFLFVINNLKSSAGDIKNDNLRSIEFLRSIISKENKEELFSDMNIGIVDVSTPGFEMPEKEGGVGLARKIGIDLALEQLDYENDKKKIIISLDADCLVEQNYLSAIVEAFNTKNLSAAYVQYEHQLTDDENEKRAIICYELFLRYYALGLKYARSRYAFPTIGSTIACDCDSYIKVGGMNNRKAGEDFYFLEKLAKITEIEKIADTRVYPSSRSSWRVPFGTGQRITRFHKGTHDEYALYDPNTFKILKEWLEIFNSGKILSAEEYLAAAEKISPLLKEFLIINNFLLSWNKILKNSKTEVQIQKQKTIWFDGFRTLKLIHFLRDNGFPAINMFKAIEELKEMESGEWRIENVLEIPQIETQLEYLSMLRSLT
jgi:hypothetical protein